jgi:hypothetical protein
MLYTVDREDNWLIKAMDMIDNLTHLYLIKKINAVMYAKLEKLILSADTENIVLVKAIIDSLQTN